MGAAVSRYDEVRRILAFHVAQPYTLGSYDCFILALHVIDTLQNRTLAGEHLWTYRTIREANDRLHQLGHKSLVSFFDAILDRKPALQCQVGDVCVVQDGRVEHAGVCLGGRFIVRTRHGVKYFTADGVIAAFEV